jgi:hypothetical protein
MAPFCDLVFWNFQYDRSRLSFGYQVDSNHILNGDSGVSPRLLECPHIHATALPKLPKKNPERKEDEGSCVGGSS